MSTLRVNQIIPYDTPNVSIDTEINVTGSISATTYYGDGSNLTGISGGSGTSGSSGTSGTSGSSGTSGGGGITEVTYSELVDLITGATLSVGSYYKITDFKTCYDQPDYDYNKNAITTGIYRDDTEIQPIIVFATSSNTISDIAYQPSYPNDKIKYDWTFSTTERTQGIAYGRISERIDEFDNRTDYDHRQIKFKRYRYYEYALNNPYNGTVQVSDISATEMIVSGTGTNFLSIGVGNRVGFENSAYKIFEVTDIVSDTEMTVTGLTNTNLNAGSKMYPTAWDEYSSYYQNNVQGSSVFEEYYTFDPNTINNINNYIGDHANLYSWQENDFILANNVFHYRFTNNKFGNACFNNSFFDDCDDNNVGNFFYNNITDDDFDGNIIGNYFYNNKITANFQYNRIGENFRNNYIVQNDFYRNNIMNGFEYNEISGGDFQNNEIGSGFNNNKIKEEFYKNDIGNGFNNNKIYWGANGNLIGNAFNYNNIYCAFYDNVIGEYFADNTLGDILNPSSKQFYENRIGVRFQTNTITNNFYKNDIGPRFYDNSISGETYSNRIGDQFENNTIYNDFRKNNIGVSFNTNTIGESNNVGGYLFENNEIMNNFKGNDILQNFWSNRLKTDFKGNQIFQEFGYNDIGFGCTSNNFSGETVHNTIGDYFVVNNLYGSFSYNTIGSDVYDNQIGDGFGYGLNGSQGNKIGNYFYNNTIGEYFYNNIIPDTFYSNTIGEFFQWNTVTAYVNGIDFGYYYGNLTGFTYVANGSTAVDNTYTNINSISENGGIEATFNIEVSGGLVVGVSGNTQGRYYEVGDTVRILGVDIGGYSGAIDTFTDDGIGKNGSDGTFTVPATGGTGSNATFTVNVTSGVVDSVTSTNLGIGYMNGDTLTIFGSLFGGTTGVDDITITVVSVYLDDIIVTVTGISPKPSVYEGYSCQIFSNSAYNLRLSYYDSSDILTITDINQ